MKKDSSITILYANRNRDLKRIRNSLDSLEKQRVQNFQVCFVDYGSDKDLVDSLKILFEEYSFLNAYFLPASSLLWNKSKALNFGIHQGTSGFIFIADVDIIFHPEATTVFQKNLDPESFFLFKMGYLPEEFKYPSEKLQAKYFGNVNGMILASAEAYTKINGLDEFFHFYGGEDEDLFRRMEDSGVKRQFLKNELFFHQWHEGYMSSKKRKRIQPNLSYAMRLNSEHLQYNERNGKTCVSNMKLEELVQQINLSKELKDPDIFVKVENRRSAVEHFLNFELKRYKGEMISVEFSIDPYYKSLKYRIKKLLGKESRQWLSFQELNDLILSSIVFNYRDYPYLYNISESRQYIIFKVQLDFKK